MKKNILIFIFAVSFSLHGQSFTYDFSSDYNGWAGDFADYPVVDSIFYELEFLRTNLPAPLNTSEYGLKISGNNHSDDLFMFIKKKISGLLPDTKYEILISVDFASNAPTGAYGVGGPPGEAVTMKAGATLIEPLKVNDDGFYFMNLDKGNQVPHGADMDTIGHVGVSDTTTVFTLINRNNSSHPFKITTDSKGEVWVCIGTDSGFEATTTIFYKKISIDFSKVTSIIKKPLNQTFMIYPNPCHNTLKIKTKPFLLNHKFRIYDRLGREIMNDIIDMNSKVINVKSFKPGLYYLKIESLNMKSYSFMKI